MERTRCGLAAVMAVSVASAVLAGCASSGHRDADGTPDYDALVSRMTGSFSSAEQAKADERYYDVRLHMVPIWTASPDGTWLYVEQAIASAMDRPYRQRVYHIIEPSPGTFVSEVYTLPDPTEWVGMWKKPAKFDGLKPTDLEEREGCAITLHRDAAGDFVGSTEGTECASDLRGASYATSEVRITETGLDSWDRGWDAAGAQVWGASDGAYRFLRITDE